MSYYQDTSLQYAPAVDLSNVTSAKECFWSCSNMIMAPSFNTSKCKDLTSFFSNCGKLVSFEGLDTTSATKLDGTFFNCAIKRNSTSSSYQPIYNCTFVNCLFQWSAAGYFNSTTSAQQCYYDASCSWDAATFEELEYLGNDGRVVGNMGGVTPYTLHLAVPKVTESQISLDPDTRVLNVNIKVSAK